MASKEQRFLSNNLMLTILLRDVSKVRGDSDLFLFIALPIELLDFYVKVSTCTRVLKLAKVFEKILLECL